MAIAAHSAEYSYFTFSFTYFFGGKAYFGLAESMGV